MRYNGTEKQNRWAEKILTSANLSQTQIENLLKYAGPKMNSDGIMDVRIVIDNRSDIAAYADALGEFYKLTHSEKKDVAYEAAEMIKIHNCL
jgi:hypothetical protein